MTRRTLAQRLKSRPRSHFQKSAPMSLTVSVDALSLVIIMDYGLGQGAFESCGGALPGTPVLTAFGD